MREKRILKFDDKTNIVAYLWQSDNHQEKINGVIQIAHGMAEHILRYDDLANFLVSKGFIVIGHDHYAHGLSSLTLEEIGVVTDYDFMDAIIKGMKLVRDEFEDLFEGHRCCLFAHSMGAMASERYLELYPDDFSHVVLSGADFGRTKYRFAKLVTKMIMGRKKTPVYSKLLDNSATMAFNKKFKKDHPTYGWLSSNMDNVLLYEDDPMCGMSFPANYYYSLSKLLLEARKHNNLSNINSKTKICLISGTLDPVSAFTNSTSKLAKMYQKMGLKTMVKLYKNARHEVHNEIQPLKDELYKDLVKFYCE